MFPGEPMVGELRLCGGPEIPVIGDRHTGYHAEREGFEPSIALRLFQFSRLALSTTQTPLLLLHDRFRSLPRWAEGTVNRSAERVGFEPTVPLRVHYLSRVANSTTLAPLRTKLLCKYTKKKPISNRTFKKVPVLQFEPQQVRLDIRKQCGFSIH